MSPAPHRIATVMDPGAAAIAEVYVEAMLQLASDDGQAEGIAEELGQIVRLMDEGDGFEELLVAEGTSSARQCRLVECIFAGRCSRQVEALLALLARNGRLVLLRQIARRFRCRLDQREGKVEVTVVAAAALGEAEKKALLEMLKELTGASPLLRTQVDSSLLGGVVVRVGDRQYDASVASELRRMRRAIGAAGTKGRLRGWEQR